MSELPPPPQLSPDGKYYWDGSRWVPVPSHSVAAPKEVGTTRTDRYGEPIAPTPQKGNPAGEPRPQPQYSADGRLYWDGQRWQPLPEASKPKPQRLSGLFVLVGALAVLVAPFLPWLEASAPLIGSISRNLISSSDGQVLAVVAAVGGVIGLVMLIRGPGITMGVLAVLVALVAGWIVAVDYQDISQRLASVSSGSGLVIADVGPGPYLAAIGILAWAVGGLVALLGRIITLARQGN